MAPGICSICGGYFDRLKVHHNRSGCGAQIIEELRASQMQHAEDAPLTGNVPCEIAVSTTAFESHEPPENEDSFPEPDPNSDEEVPPQDSMIQPSFVPRRADGKRTVKMSARFKQYYTENQRQTFPKAAKPKASKIQVHPNDDIISHLTAQSQQQLSDIEMPPLEHGNSEEGELQNDPEVQMEEDEVLPTTEEFGAASNSRNPIIWLPADTYQNSTHLFTKQQKAYMRIYNLFESIGAPHYAIDQLVKILVEEEAHLDLSTLPSRATFVKHVLKRFGGPPLTEHVVHLETPNDKDGKIHHGFRDTVTVYTFDCEHQIRDLFSDDSLFGDINNLVVNSSNPFHPYEPEPVEFDSCEEPGHYIEEVRSASWYQNYVSERIKNKDFEFAGDSAIYMDKTGNDLFQRFSLEPLMWTTTLLRKEVRNSPRGSRVLAFIPNLASSSSASKQTGRKGMTVRNYHKCLHVALEGLRKVQAKSARGEFHIALRLGSFVRVVNMHLPVSMVLGDAKSNDNLCGRYGSYSQGTYCMCRACNVDFEHSDRPGYRCTFRTPQKYHQASQVALEPFDPQQHQGLIATRLNQMKSLHRKRQVAAEKYLASRSQHAFISGFIGVDFGGSNRGINAATPTDPMHAFLEGVAKYVIAIFVGPLPPALKHNLDRLVDKLFGSLRSGERSSYPRCNFTHGFSNLTLLTADERGGMLFSLFLILCSSEGHSLLRHYFREDAKLPEEDIDSDGSDLSRVEDVSDDGSLEVKSDASYESTYCPFDWDAKLEEWESVDVEETLNQYVFYQRVRGSNGERQKKEDDLHTSEETLQSATRVINSEGLGLLSDEESSQTDSCIDENTVRPCTYHDMIDLLETMLSFHAFYKGDLPIPWQASPCVDDNRMPFESEDPTGYYILGRIRKMVQKIITRLPRQTGNRWKIQKLHELLHLPSDIHKFGKPRQFDTAQWEHNLIEKAKKPARTAQKQSISEFEKQTASRLHVAQAMNKCSLAMNITSEITVQQTGAASLVKIDDSDCCSVVGYRKFLLSYLTEQESVEEFWFSEQKSSHTLALHPAVKEFLIRTFVEDLKSGQRIFGWTEAYIYGELFRAHPDYRSQGLPWYDWGILEADIPEEAEIENSEESETINSNTVRNTDVFAKKNSTPVKVLAFVRIGEEAGLSDDVDGMYAVVQRAVRNTILRDGWSDRKSNLVHRYQLNFVDDGANSEAGTENQYRIPQLELVGLASIKKRVLVVEEDPIFSESREGTRSIDHDNVLLVQPYSEWERYFLDISP